MSLTEGLGDLMLRCDAEGTAESTTVATLLAYARGVGYFSGDILKGPYAPPPETSAVELTARAVDATRKEAEAKPVDPATPALPDQKV